MKDRMIAGVGNTQVEKGRKNLGDVEAATSGVRTSKRGKFVKRDTGFVNI